jgi:hypothetical protein
MLVVMVISLLRGTGMLQLHSARPHRASAKSLLYSELQAPGESHHNLKRGDHSTLLGLANQQLQSDFTGNVPSFACAVLNVVLEHMQHSAERSARHTSDEKGKGLSVQVVSRHLSSPIVTCSHDQFSSTADDLTKNGRQQPMT